MTEPAFGDEWSLFQGRGEEPDDRFTSGGSRGGGQFDEERARSAVRRGEVFHREFSPERRERWVGLISDRLFAEISVLSSRQAYWEFFLAAGFLTGAAAPGRQVNLRAAAAFIRTGDEQVREVISGLVQLPIPVILRAGEILSASLEIADLGQPLRLVTAMDICFDLCENNPDYIQCIEDCLSGSG
jgi:hypothetical protein